MELPDAFEQVLFQFPKSSLAPLTGSLSDVIGHPIAGNSAGRDLCASLIEALYRHIDDFNSEAMHGFSETAINLFIQVFDNELCHRAESRSNSVNGNTVAEIAYEFGFNDISHFCRDFKTAYHLTPGEYRSSYRNSVCN